MCDKDLREMADRIKLRRTALNLTQEQFSELSGISHSSYTKIENAFQQPSLDTLISICLNLKVSLDYLIFGTEEPQTPTTSTDMFDALLAYADKDKLMHTSQVLNMLADMKD